MADAIRGTYADFKLIKTRGVVQFVVEIPIENVDEVIALFGMPQYGAEQWVAVAPLKPEAEPATPTARQDAYQDKSPGEQAVARAAILCGEVAFQTWLCGNNHSGEDFTIGVLRTRCGIKSRSEIATDEFALLTFQNMETQYRDHQRYGPMP